MTYTSVEQRIAKAYIDMFPPFIAHSKSTVTVSEQAHFYSLIKDLYQLAFDEPLLFVPALHEDDAYPNRFHKSSYGKPELQINMQKFMKAMDTLLQCMYHMGQGGEVKRSKRQNTILTRLGIDDPGTLPPAWVWMSTRPGSSLTAFSYCLFDPDYPYTADIYARLLGDGPFRKLENWMLQQGYRRFDIFDVTASICKLSLTYANPAWSDAPPKGGFEYKIRHTGISARYDAFVREPVVFGLCIPNGPKTYLEHFDTMDGQLQHFVMTHTKKCDACRYCVQTDKTGTRPLAYVHVHYKESTYSLCPYFPGYSYCWTSIDDALADRLIETLSFMDRFI